MENKKKEIRYSKILKDFVHPTIHQGDDIQTIEQKYAFGIHVWNATNIKGNHPELFEKSKKEVIEKSTNQTEVEALFKEMVNFKEKEFADYNKVIVDFEVIPKKGADYNITVASAKLKE